MFSSPSPDKQRVSLGRWEDTVLDINLQTVGIIYGHAKGPDLPARSGNIPYTIQALTLMYFL